MRSLLLISALPADHVTMCGLGPVDWEDQLIQRKLTGDQLTAARTSSRSQGLAFLLLSLIALDSAGCPASANGGDQVDTGQSMFDPEASDTSREGGRGVNGGFTLRSYDTSMGGRGVGSLGGSEAGSDTSH